ncbi:MAG: PAS domain-containing protein [Thermoanaerobaculia bacterium]|nr:PAS domain-containing protein [Thermoanaerobaculia bacterium]
MLWGAFGAFALFTAAGVAVTTAVLQVDKRHEYEVVHGSRPLLETVRTMDDAIETMVSAARAYLLTGQSQFIDAYDKSVLTFREAEGLAVQLADEPRDQRMVSDLRRHFVEVRGLTDRQIALYKEDKKANALEFMLETTRILNTTPRYGRMILERHRNADVAALDGVDSFRTWVMMTLLLLAIVIVAGAAFAMWRIEQSLVSAITRQSKRTEAMIAGMSDGVMLIDGEGRTVFINPAAKRLLGGGEIGIPIVKHAATYGLFDQKGRPLSTEELPMAQALATGRTITDVTVLLIRGSRRVSVSMSATPLKEEGKTTGVVVTFRDITERRRLEEAMQLQAERAQILADAGAFFASNIDPAWVTQAIAERTAEALGDWAAVVLKTGDSKELRVASIYHRDMASLGLAWSYIYRQPLTVGEGIVGQVVATGYPSLTRNLGLSGGARTDDTSYHAPSMRLASLLILPLRTRRETLGALLIAANDPARAMTDDNLPLAELLAERAGLAVENAKLYTDQVEARKKVEDLSRLKDEFLSIASHELRTPVTSIKGYTQLAKTLIRENDLATSEEYLDIALDQIDRMSRLIIELLDVSRIETGRLEIRREPIPWCTFVRDVVHRHHTAVSDRRFHLNVPDAAKTVSGDRDRLEQVLGNLLENAVKYSPEGSDVFVSVVDRGDQMVTSVCDRGIGIPADELKQVFERFHRGRQVSSSNYGGLGLGLYITRQIIERHAGTIWVESQEGSGTTFHFSLPVSEVGAAVATA